MRGQPQHCCCPAPAEVLPNCLPPVKRLPATPPSLPRINTLPLSYLHILDIDSVIKITLIREALNVTVVNMRCDKRPEEGTTNIIECKEVILQDNTAYAMLQKRPVVQTIQSTKQLHSQWQKRGHSHTHRNTTLPAYHQSLTHSIIHSARALP